ncbi:ferric-chelate reductase, putative [Talaromyces islandicus]|uniref:Ferric-chelate reductase, putative n=1 Tax=Talaromyces islandicus TaxID=28573 RepID=A0A0U1LRI8_TALIS|nr:ferric-chelate reductase, putative [Talaromyces islandicus]
MMRSVANGQRLNVMALAEGPYGGLHSYDSYGTTLLIAGGIGITHPISYLRELVNGFINRSVATRRITLLWVVRSVDHLQWVQPWMNYILNHPALQGAVTFSSKNAHPHTSFHVDDDVYFQQTFSLSIHVHLTSYYSESGASSPGGADRSLPQSSSHSSSLLSEDDTDFDPIDASVFSEHVALPSHYSLSSLSSSFRYSYPSSSDDMPNYGSSFTSYTYSNPTSKENHTCDNHSYNNYSNNSQYKHYTHMKSIRNQDWTQLDTAPITISLGKPLFRQLLEREMAQQVGAMAVSVCGPGSMSDEVRKAVRDVQGRKSVDFFEESFSW